MKKTVIDPFHNSTVRSKKGKLQEYNTKVISQFTDTMQNKTHQIHYSSKKGYEFIVIENIRSQQKKS